MRLFTGASSKGTVRSNKQFSPRSTCDSTHILSNVTTTPTHVFNGVSRLASALETVRLLTLALARRAPQTSCTLSLLP